jgi:hypothetical protein
MSEGLNNHDHFCKLILEEKTFQILLKYISTCKSGTDFLPVDNEIQRKELETHIYLNWMDKNAGVHWVKDYAKEFRTYLNSIKLLWAAHVLEFGHDNAFTYDEYCRLVKNWPNVKEVLEGLY